ncbi:glycosyltransferase [uncultured Polaribacter sp.]|uniref:glycosyltransferase family 2 protein n=1 Tax=uncultured Polaribacter sp. TaxID=174711 RepID=UPI00260E4DB6|nr:glycosyltransferase [uncultured Polaribacter sp.]
MILGVTFIGFLYFFFIISLRFGFDKVDLSDEFNQQPTTSFSVIIPFRNEADNLVELLNSILELNYPKNLVEFLFVNDDSTDNSVEIIEHFIHAFSKKSTIKLATITILNNHRISNSPKKDAITTAIDKANFDWIVTTDADCTLPKNWLNAFDTFIQKNKPNMVVAPVNYVVDNSFIQQFQLLDFMSMQATTIGSFGLNFPFLCNGANLAYKKSIFFNVNGFEGNATIASGDDVFLLEKYTKYNQSKVHYLKSSKAIVSTSPVKNWSELIEQRKRWAAKAANFSSLKVKCIGFLIVFTNLIMLYLLCSGNFKLLLFIFSLKLIVDWVLFKPTLAFFNHQKNDLVHYIFSSFFYPFFSLYIFLLSMTTKYNWKGRNFKK